MVGGADAPQSTNQEANTRPPYPHPTNQPSAADPLPLEARQSVSLKEVPKERGGKRQQPSREPRTAGSGEAPTATQDPPCLQPSPAAGPLPLEARQPVSRGIAASHGAASAASNASTPLPTGPGVSPFPPSPPAAAPLPLEARQAVSPGSKDRLRQDAHIAAGSQFGTQPTRAMRRLLRTLPRPDFPVVLLAAFDGIATAATILRWAGVHLSMYVAWDTDADATAVAKAHHQDIQCRGDLFADDPATVRAMIQRAGPEAAVLIAAGPPCPDFSRIRHAPPGHQGTEGSKFTKFIKFFRDAVPADRTVFWVVENVVMNFDQQQVADKALGTTPTMIDAAQFGPVTRPRLWWTSPKIAQSIVKADNSGQARPDVPKLSAAEVEVNGRLHQNILDGKSCLPCFTTPAPDEKGRPPPKHARMDATTEARWRKDGRTFAPWHYTDKATVQTAGERRVLNSTEKEQLHWFPTGYTKKAKDDRARHRLLGNSWHAGVAAFVLLHTLTSVTAIAATPSRSYVQEAASLWLSSSIAFGPAPTQPRPSHVLHTHCPEAHLRAALQQCHDMDELPTIDPSIQYCVDMQHRLGARLPAWRAAIMQEIKQMVTDNEEATNSWATTLAPHVHKAYHQGSTTQIPTLCELLQTVQYPDAALYHELHTGFPMVGHLSPGVNWPLRADEKYLHPISWTQFKERNQKYLRQKSRETPHETHGQGMLDEIRAEASAGRLEGPFRPPESWETPGVDPSLPPCPDEEVYASAVFPIIQIGSDGQDKVRRGEDWRRSHHNATVVAQDAPMHHTVDHFIALAKAFAAKNSAPRAQEAASDGSPPPAPAGGEAGEAAYDVCDLLVWGHDHEGAYRQLPLRHPPHAYLLIVTNTGPQLWRHNVLLFGAAASVWSYNRFGDAMTALARALLLVPALHYVDDFGSIEPAWSAPSAFDSFTEMNAALGLKMKPSKAQPPRAEHKVQGVQLQLRQNAALAAPSPSRMRKISSFISRKLEEDRLTSADAAALAGKLTFMQTTMFGKVGRATIKPVYARQHQSHRCDKLDVPLRATLEVFPAILSSAPPRLVHLLRRRRRRTVVYADAFVQGGDDAKKRLKLDELMDMRNGWGFVVIPPREQPFYAYGSVPTDTLLASCPNRAYIYFLEAWAQILAVLAAGPHLTDSFTSFVDNKASEYALIKGMGCTPILNHIIGAFWHIMANDGLSPWFERVTSAANIADAVSRFELDFARSQGWREVSLGHGPNALLASWAAQLPPWRDATYKLRAAVTAVAAPGNSPAPAGGEAGCSLGT